MKRHYSTYLKDLSYLHQKVRPSPKNSVAIKIQTEDDIKDNNEQNDEIDENCEHLEIDVAKLKLDKSELLKKKKKED